jgi:hypothetical protein
VGGPRASVTPAQQEAALLSTNCRMANFGKILGFWQLDTGSATPLPILREPRADSEGRSGSERIQASSIIGPDLPPAPEALALGHSSEVPPVDSDTGVVVTAIDSDFI